MSHLPFVEKLVKGLVDAPDQVSIEEDNAAGARTYFVTVAPEDVGKVIGKNGRVVSAIRFVVSAIAAKDRERAFVKVVTD